MIQASSRSMSRSYNRRNESYSKAEGKDVTARIQRDFRARLFGREIIQCADDLAGPGEMALQFVQPKGQAEIQHLRFQIRSYQHVCGFEVAMDDSMLVQKTNRQYHLAYQFHFVAQAQGARN